MPLCYGGGVTTKEEAKKIIKLGAEKVALSAAVIANPQLVKEIGYEIGVQSVVVVIDVKKKGLFSKYDVVTHNATKSTGLNPIELAKQFEALGVGEIVINSVDQEGTGKGFDQKLIDAVRKEITVPLTVMGGASNIQDFKELIDKYKVIGISAGSFFVFKGKYKAVLISYPTYNAIMS